MWAGNGRELQQAPNKGAYVGSEKEEFQKPGPMVAGQDWECQLTRHIYGREGRVRLTREGVSHNTIHGHIWAYEGSHFSNRIPYARGKTGRFNKQAIPGRP